MTDEQKARRKAAMEKLLKFVNSRDVFPYQEDYDREFTESEQYQLLKDLGAEDDLRLFRADNPRLAIFAILNIEALRHMRRQKGEPEFITINERLSWHQDNELAFN